MDQSLMTVETTGIIPGKEYAIDESNPIRMMAREILAGRTEPFSEEEVTELIDRRYFSFESIVPITDNEEELLKTTLLEDLMYYLNNGPTRKFLLAECFLVGNAGRRNDQEIVSVNSRTPIPKSLNPMTPEEKIIFLSDPKNLKVFWEYEYGSSTLALMGYRPISDYGMFGSTERFTQTIRRIQKATGKSQLNILDLGGGVGLALYDAKRLHPELVTYNTTRDEEYGSYGVDFQIVCFLERMPRQLRGKIDYIFSNMATRYIAFCDLTLQGCIEALAIGGTMEVLFSSEKSCNRNLEDVKNRTKTAYEYLKDLETAKLIQLQINGRIGNNISRSTFMANERSLYPASKVIVTRL
ncbi:MAG: hypothetical protein WC473_03075 [Patescibacteria group bacterium]